MKEIQDKATKITNDISIFFGTFDPDFSMIANMQAVTIIKVRMIGIICIDVPCDMVL